jgi:outer membrane lipoprotein-sorting protein
MLKHIYLLASVATLLMPPTALGDEAPQTAINIIQNMNNRDEGTFLSRDMTIQLIDRKGHTRTQQTKTLRRYFDDAKKTVIFYKKPANVSNTAFLTWDYFDTNVDDDQWLYLPALRKVRRISASGRGDYFLGTDLTYEEIKKDGKIAEEDYHFTLQGQEEVEGINTWVVEAIPNSPENIEELGYSRILLYVDGNNWMPRLIKYWDEAGNYLKATHLKNIQKIDGIWSALNIHVENSKTGHKTELEFSNVKFLKPIAPRLFEKEALKRGF